MLRNLRKLFLFPGVAILLLHGNAHAGNGDKEIEILKFISSDGKVAIFDEHAKPVGEMMVSDFALPLPVLDTARHGRLYKIGENKWVRSIAVQINQTATLAPNNQELIDRRGGASDENSHSSRGLK